MLRPSRARFPSLSLSAVRSVAAKVAKDKEKNVFTLAVLSMLEKLVSALGSTAREVSGMKLRPPLSSLLR